MSIRAPLFVIACGGTGGHLFPGIAVGERLVEAGARVVLVVSGKEVDQRAVGSARDMEVWTLEGALASRGSFSRFVRSATGFVCSFRDLRRRFKAENPLAVLAMGGFTSAAPAVAGRWMGARVFLHEANAIPGRATRWLAALADEVFVFFPEAANLLRRRTARVVGMPVRPQFQPLDSGSCRISFGLAPGRPVLLVVGGSQGARPLNRLMREALPCLIKKFPELQYLHLTGSEDLKDMTEGYRAHGAKAVTRPFLTEMEWALGAAEVALSRAGGSSLAEFAAMALPSVLVPYPHAADDHQRANALAFSRSGAGVLLDQSDATPESLSGHLQALLGSESTRANMRKALQQWHRAGAADAVARRLLDLSDPAWRASASVGFEPAFRGSADGAAFGLGAPGVQRGPGRFE